MNEVFMPVVDAKEYRDKVFRCPFCLLPLYKIYDIETPFGTMVEGGKCSCGAVFMFNASGKNLGDTYSDVLAFAYDWDFDAAFGAGEGEYEEATVRMAAGKYLLGDGSVRDRTPKYLFVKRLAPGSEE
jgi:hypothetical protein